MRKYTTKKHKRILISWTQDKCSICGKYLSKHKGAESKNLICHICFLKNHKDYMKQYHKDYYKKNNIRIKNQRKLRWRIYHV